MATIPFWYDEPGAWDTCALGVFVLPGRARVTVSRTKPIDIRKAPGQYGATLIIMGSEPAQVSITLTMWSAEQWAAAVSILGAIELPNPKPQAYAITHPVPNSRGVNGVVVQTIAGPNVGSIVGTVEYTLSCLESLPPLKVPSLAPKLSIAGHTTPISNPTPPSVATPPKP